MLAHAAIGRRDFHAFALDNGDRIIVECAHAFDSCLEFIYIITILIFKMRIFLGEISKTRYMKGGRSKRNDDEVADPVPFGTDGDMMSKYKMIGITTTLPHARHGLLYHLGTMELFEKNFCAISFARKKYKETILGDFRLDWNLNFAHLLADNAAACKHKLPLDLIIAALFYGILKETDCTIDEIEAEFGTVVSSTLLYLSDDKKEKESLGKSLYFTKKINNLSSDPLLIELTVRFGTISKLGLEYPRKYPKYAKETKIVCFDQFKNQAALGPVHLRVLSNIQYWISRSETPSQNP